MNKLPLLILMMSCMATVTHADPMLDRMRDQLRQTVTQMRQLEDENLSLKAQLANVVPVKAAPVVVKSNTVELNQLRANARRESEKSTALQAQLEQANSQIQQLQQSLSQLSFNAKTQQQSLLNLDGQLKTTNQKQSMCEEQNKQLAALSTELIDRYQQQNVWQALKNHEPVTGLYRVKLENMLQDYQGKISQATVTPPTTNEMANDATISP